MTTNKPLRTLAQKKERVTQEATGATGRFPTEKKDDPRASFAGGVRQLIREHASDDVIDPVYADWIADQIIHDFDIFLNVYDADRAEEKKRLADKLKRAIGWNKLINAYIVGPTDNGAIREVIAELNQSSDSPRGDNTLTDSTAAAETSSKGETPA